MNRNADKSEKDLIERANKEAEAWHELHPTPNGVIVLRMVRDRAHEVKPEPLPTPTPMAAPEPTHEPLHTVASAPKIRPRIATITEIEESGPSRHWMA